MKRRLSCLTCTAVKDARRPLTMSKFRQYVTKRHWKNEIRKCAGAIFSNYAGLLNREKRRELSCGVRRSWIALRRQPLRRLPNRHERIRKSLCACKEMAAMGWGPAILPCGGI